MERLHLHLWRLRIKNKQKICFIGQSSSRNRFPPRWQLEKLKKENRARLFIQSVLSFTCWNQSFFPDLFKGQHVKYKNFHLFKWCNSRTKQSDTSDLLQTLSPESGKTMVAKSSLFPTTAVLCTTLGIVRRSFTFPSGSSLDCRQYSTIYKQRVEAFVLAVLRKKDLYVFFLFLMPCSNLAWRRAVPFTYLHVVTWGQPDPSQTTQCSWCSQCNLDHQTCKVSLSPTALGNNTFTHLEVSFFFYSFNLLHIAKLNSFSKN